MTPFNDRYVLELEVIDGSDLVVPSHRVPTGLYVSASTSLGQWSTSIKPVMADHGVRWEEPLVIRSRPLNFPRWLMPIFPSNWKVVHLEIRASFETAMLGRGELMHRVDATVGELLAHGEQFEIPFSITETLRPSLLLRARCIKPQQLAVQHHHPEIDTITDAAHEAYAFYRQDNHRDDLDSAIESFRTVLARCPDGDPYRAAALCNLAHPILYGSTDDVPNNIDHAISLFCDALALRPQGHPDRPLSIHNLCRAHYLRYSCHHNPADLREATKLYLELLPMCIDGSYLQYRVIEECNLLPGRPSSESISLRRMILRLCPQGHRDHAHSLKSLAEDTHIGNPASSSQQGEVYFDLRNGRKSSSLGPHESQQPRPICILTTFRIALLSRIVDTVPQTRPQSRNVVIFGETGAGKSSVINAIAQDMCAKISNEAAGCTRCHKEYNVNISGKNFVIFDTAGLGEGTEGTVPADKAARDLKSLFRALQSIKSDGVGLLVYCVRGTRACRALSKNYKYVYSVIRQKNVPIVLVATGLEDYEPIMEGWWENNRAQFHNCDMFFKDQACITTIPKGPLNSAIIDQRIKESCESLRSLILNNCLE